MNMDPQDPVPISALNDYLYCTRRCALHRIDGWWQDNAHTVSGTIAHEIADDPGYRETAAGARIERALPLFSRKLNLVGKADIVEFWPGADGTAVPLPVDYKLGKRRKWDNDDVQLCAQALCLEEMLGTAVPRGAVYHVKTHRRREVIFDAALRHLTLQTLIAVRQLLDLAALPPAAIRPQCNGCSMHQVCVPEISGVLIGKAAFAQLFEPQA